MNRVKSHIEVIEKLESLEYLVNSASLEIIQAFNSGCKLLLCGNGGSASDAQHIAAEFVGRFVYERDGLPAIALTTDTSALTAISNDYGYDNVFSRQVQALALPGDVLIAISTSGNSKNVCNAVAEAKRKGCYTIALTGKSGGVVDADINIIVPSDITSHIQESHILIGHIICEIVDENIKINKNAK